jgi:hypothetical protein
MGPAQPIRPLHGSPEPLIGRHGIGGRYAPHAMEPSTEPSLVRREATWPGATGTRGANHAGITASIIAHQLPTAILPHVQPRRV